MLGFRKPLKIMKRQKNGFTRSLVRLLLYFVMGDGAPSWKECIFPGSKECRGKELPES